MTELQHVYQSAAALMVPNESENGRKKGREWERVTVSHLIRASSHPHVCGGDIPVYTDGYLWLAVEARLWKLLAGLVGEVPWTTDEAASLGPFHRQEFRKGEDTMKRSGNAPFAFLRTLIWFLMWKFNKLTKRMKDRPTMGDLYFFLKTGVHGQFL